jgi:hypothetical protein
MFEPTASITSMDSVLVSSHGRRLEGVGLGGQRADRAEVDDVALQLGGQRLLEIGGDLGMSSPRPISAQLGMPATSVVKRTQRVQWMQRFIDRLDQRADILVLDRALVLGVAEACRRRRPSPGPAGRTRRPGRRSGNPAGG